MGIRLTRIERACAQLLSALKRRAAKAVFLNPWLPQYTEGTHRAGGQGGARSAVADLAASEGKLCIVATC